MKSEAERQAEVATEQRAELRKLDGFPAPKAKHAPGVNGGPDDVHERDGANARLIAAAPDLLNALWLAADRLQSAAHTLTNPEHVSACVAALAVARAAIAKAEGC